MRTFLRSSTAARALFLVTFAVPLLSATSSYSAGYGLRESSTVAMGSAYAGASATAGDASFLSYNPASLGGVRDCDSSLSLVGIFPTSSAVYGSTTSAGTPAGGLGTPADFISDAAVPDLAARMRLSPNWAAGIAIYAPWGLSTDYPAGWAGRYYARETKLLTVNITPTISYQPSSHLTVAAGLQVQYAKGTLSSATDIGTLGASLAIPGSVPGAQDGSAKLTGDDWALGFTLGAMADVADGVSVGLSYHSAVHHTLEGPLTFTLDSAGVGAAIRSATGLFADTAAQAKLTTPATVNFGTRWMLGDGWTGLFELDWTNWSGFRELRVHAANLAQPDDVTTAKWKDAWLVSLGLEYQPDPYWVVRAGVALDQSPVPSATLEPRIPDADRTWISAGVTYRASEALDLSLSLSHLFLPGRNVALTAVQPGNMLRGNLTGTTKSSVNVVGLQLNYRLPR